MVKQDNPKTTHGEISIHHLTECETCGIAHEQTCVQCMAASHLAGMPAYCKRCAKAAEGD